MAEADFSRRLLILLCAAALPVVGAAQDSDTGDTDGDTDGPPPTYDHCVAWAADVQGACPTGEGVTLDLECDVPLDPAAPGLYIDGQCCYTMIDNVCVDDRAIGCGCSHGRPLVIAGTLRTASPVVTRAWFDERLAPPSLEGLDGADRARLAHFWASIAINEHASIASFHRLGLELLAHGAPADLLVAAQRAAMDEVRHARRAFTLASHFAGGAIGPAPLKLGDSLPLSPDRIALAVAAVREACIEETLSVVAAAEMLSAAQDPAVREILRGIVADETRHAELAWRLVRWVIDTEGEPARKAVRKAFSEATDAGKADPWPPRAGLAAWGCVGDDALRVAVARARREVVDVAAARLCA